MSDEQPITWPHRLDLEHVRMWLERMIKSMRFVELVSAILTLISRMATFNEELVKQLANARRSKPRSETLVRVERQQAFAFAMKTISPAKSPVVDDSDKKRKASRKGKHPGRAEFPAHIERTVVVNAVPSEQRICPRCGSEMKTISHETCEKLEIIPARLVVVQRMDETVACPHDETIISATPPPQVVEKGKLGTTLIVEALADKYLEHQPIERQCQRWQRAGVEVAPQTLGRSVGAAVDLLKPIATCIAERTREPGLLSTDASGIPVLDRSAPEGIRSGTIWCWINRRWVCFVYSRRGDANSVRCFLGDILRRTVQCDGTTVTSFIERAGGRRPGCMAHGRRRFVDAAKAGDLYALEGLRIIGGLFAVERAATRAGDTNEQRKTRRQRDSKPILDKLRTWFDELRKRRHRRRPLERRSYIYIDNGRACVCF